MALEVLHCPWLSKCPRVTLKDGVLEAQSSRKVVGLTLGAYWRHFLADPHTRQCHLHRRLLWTHHTHRQMDFDAIDHIDYTFEAYPTSLTLGSHGLTPNDTLESFTVRLIPKSRRTPPMSLFTFFGEGTQPPDALTFGRGLDLAGTQERESREFVNLLAQVTGLPLCPQIQIQSRTPASPPPHPT